MAITAYTGRPGAGKSYGVVANVVVPALEQGRRVWTNIPLKMDAIEASYPGADVTIFDTQAVVNDPDYVNTTVPKGAIVIFDECWKIWPAGVKPAQVPDAYKTFLAEHRHRVGNNGESMEIVLVTQDLSQIATFARDLVDKTFIATKLDSVGAANRFKLHVCQGCVKGDNPPKARYLRTIQGKYKQDIYRFYQSHTLADNPDGAAGLEVAADSRANILKGSFFTFWLPLTLLGAIGGLYLAWNAFYSISGGENEQTADKHPPQQAPAPPTKPARAPDPSPAEPDRTPPDDSERYRLVGTIVAPNYRRAIIYSDDGARRIGMSSCEQFGDTGEWYCFVDGHRVTGWAGPKPPDDIAQPSVLSSVTKSS